ncbi:hypothetical protein P692DRAFT_20839784 [Suillus brevipes Sb2]|nr:hypothetical protein P692DRAFT_20839784 [Suillus brevipes Sb2]
MLHGIGITPETDAEAAAAMQRTNDEVDDSTQTGQPTAGVSQHKHKSQQSDWRTLRAE